MRRLAATLPLLATLGALACREPEAPSSPTLAPITPGSAKLHRLTDLQYRNAVHDLLGVDYTGALPEDTSLYGYTTVGGSTATLSPVELEEVETAAWSIATTVVADETARDRLVGCQVALPLGYPPDRNDDCVRAWITDFGLRAWRRPLAGEEIDEMAALYWNAAETTDATVGVQALVAAFLLSPHFLYRVELGEPDPEDPRKRRLSGFELATRLSFFLTNRPPDEALRLAAERGDLETDEGLRQHAERLYATEDATLAMVRFFDETMDLYKLELVAKDATMFPEFTESLRGKMREEMQLVFQDVVLENDLPVNELFTTDVAYMDGELAQIYGLHVGGDTMLRIEMPEMLERGGILGRAAFPTLNANATINSPTHRGKWVRTRVLCGTVPPPPGQVATLESLGSEGTLRDRLARHMEDPACAGCHRLMDPIGFGFEHLDPVGAWQELDNGLPVDATGEIDGDGFDGAAELGEVVASHPDLPGCFARQLYRHAKGELEGDGELPVLDVLTQDYVAGGQHLPELVLGIVLSEGFRTIDAPEGEACTEDGATRDCATACGRGTETCDGVSWKSCSAPAPGPETCDGTDEDCDGQVDEGVVRACGSDAEPGVQVCADATWQGCDSSMAGVEVCNGLDDDRDGTADEGLTTNLLTVSVGSLTAAHESCDPSSDLDSGACHAAIHRTCAGSGCGASGAAGVAFSDNGAQVAISCFDGATGVNVSTSFTELSAYHGGCTASTPRGPDCFAAVNRYCAARGQTTGYGPVEYSGDDALVVCTPGAAVSAPGYSGLVGYNAVCDGSTQRMGQDCNEAMHLYCQAQGWLTGFGPLENSGDVAYVACLGAP